MPSWINNPEACYVLAAYGIAGIMLFGLLFFSWLAARKHKAEWQRLKGNTGQ